MGIISKPFTLRYTIITNLKVNPSTPHICKKKTKILFDVIQLLQNVSNTKQKLIPFNSFTSIKGSEHEDVKVLIRLYLCKLGNC